MSLPLFVMAAAFMRRGGVAQALVDLSTAWLGGVKGSLGLVAVVSCALFAAISGSSVATALAMGTILLPAMLERGYPRGFALGVIGASGTIGMVIPPSLALILYGIVTEQSVPRLFLAGILPGLLQAGGVLPVGAGTTRAARIFRSSRRCRCASGCASRCGRCRRWRCRSWCWSASTAAS